MEMLGRLGERLCFAGWLAAFLTWIAFRLVRELVRSLEIVMAQRFVDRPKSANRYRLCFFDLAKHIVKAIEFESGTDDDAIAHALTLDDDGCNLELRSGARVVARSGTLRIELQRVS
jgi:hypothetical protein